VTAREFYTHRLQVRPLCDANGDVVHDHDGAAERDDALTRWARLFQEYCCTALAKIEGDRLEWLRKNQQRLRVDLYVNLADAVGAHDGNAGDDIAAGRRVVLPSTFSGGPRDMRQRYHDAMACVRKKGNPSFFITMTANPKWEEVARELAPGQQARARLAHTRLCTLTRCQTLPPDAACCNVHRYKTVQTWLHASSASSSTLCARSSTKTAFLAES
jgi:hypothetical protein